MSFTYSRTYKGQIQLVIFDWAGTTVDFGCQAPVDAFVKGFRNRGVEVSMEAARLPMGMEKRDHIAAVAAMDEVARSWMEVHGREISEEDIDAMFNDFSSLLLASIEAKSNLLPGVRETVDQLQTKGIKIGASTGYFTEAAEIVINNGAAAGYRPDYTICASDVSSGRPNPWMIYRTMEALDVCPPEAVVNVGDTTVDIEFALNAGVWSVGIAETGNQMGLSEEELNALPPNIRREKLNRARKSLSHYGAHYVIDRIIELPNVIEDINTRLQRGEKP